MSRISYLRTIRRDELSYERVRDAMLRRINEIPHRLMWELPTRESREARERLRAYKDRHRGERCFVVANGPSLRTMDLEPLKREFTIGMNRIYRLREINGFLPNYLVVIDIDSQIEQIYKELRDVETTLFVNWNARRYFEARRDLNFLKLTFRPRFSTDLEKGIWGGHSVTYACIQLAYYLGFSEVILVGKDHNYHNAGVPGAVVRSTGEEQNHFIQGYYKKGMTWRIPDYKGEELAYRMAREAFERSGRRILDATIGGKLDVFPKVDFEGLFS